MTRTDKQTSFEKAYEEKLKLLKEIWKSQDDFIKTFRLPGFEDETEESMTGGGDSSAASPVSGNSNEDKAWNFFASKGFTAAAAAGVMGNLKQESGVDPKKRQYGGGPGTGLCQWEKGGRWDSLVSWAKKAGKDEWAMETQLEYLWEELNGKDPTTKSILDKRYGGLTGLSQMSDYKDACDAFEKSFERAGKPNMAQRYKYAEAYLEKYGKGDGGAPAKEIASNATGDAKKVIDVAQSWLSKNNRYVFGGGRKQSDIEAGKFDCSSFMRYCYAEAGYDIFNNGGALSGNTDTIMGNSKLGTVKTSELKEGDLMFFDTYKTYGHVTINLGNGKAIGTQSSSGVGIVDYENNSYWKKRISNKHKRVF